MKHRYSLLLLLCVALFAVDACGKGNSPTAPVTVAPVLANVAGTWSGTAKPNEAPAGFAMMIATTLAQTSANVTGTFTCASFFCIGPSGTLTATVSTDTFTAQIAFPNGATCGTFKGTVSNGGNKMEGTYVCAGAEVSDQGTWQMTKQ